MIGRASEAERVHLCSTHPAASVAGEEQGIEAGPALGEAGI